MCNIQSALSSVFRNPLLWRWSARQSWPVLILKNTTASFFDFWLILVQFFCIFSHDFSFFPGGIFSKSQWGSEDLLIEVRYHGLQIDIDLYLQYIYIKTSLYTYFLNCSAFLIFFFSFCENRFIRREKNYLNKNLSFLDFNQ